MDLMNLDQSLLSLKNAVADWMTANPYSTALLSGLITWTALKTPWKWDDRLIEKLKWWK